jgi:hypothetical protein
VRLQSWQRDGERDRERDRASALARSGSISELIPSDFGVRPLVPIAGARESQTSPESEPKSAEHGGTWRDEGAVVCGNVVRSYLKSWGWH